MVDLKHGFADFRDFERSADTGKRSSKKSTAKLNLEFYLNKKYFTPEQVAAIDTAFKDLPTELIGFSKSEIESAKMYERKLHEFYAKHKVYRENIPGIYDSGKLFFHTEEMPQMKSTWGYNSSKKVKLAVIDRKFKPIRTILSRGRGLKHYKPLDRTVMFQIEYLLNFKGQEIDLRRSEMEEIMQQNKVMLSQGLRDRIQQYFVRFGGKIIK